MKQLIDEIIEECRPYTATGKVASYIPELSKADPRDLGICVIAEDGSVTAGGEFDKPFTMQSMGVSEETVVLPAVISPAPWRMQYTSPVAFSTIACAFSVLATISKGRFS